MTLKMTIDKQKFRTHQMSKNVANYDNGLSKIFTIDLNLIPGFNLQQAFNFYKDMGGGVGPI